MHKNIVALRDVRDVRRARNVQNVYPIDTKRLECLDITVLWSRHGGGGLESVCAALFCAVPCRAAYSAGGKEALCRAMPSVPTQQDPL